MRLIRYLQLNTHYKFFFRSLPTGGGPFLSMILSHSRFAACKKARKNLSLYALGPQLGLKVDDVQNRKSNNVRIRVKYFLHSTFVRLLN